MVVGISLRPTMAFSDLYPSGPLIVPFNTHRPKALRQGIDGMARGTKTTAVYLAHSYPTKVPPEAIQPFIAHFTRPGDVICDPFAGSGMTGVAARRMGRHAVLSDLSPLAVHLATNVTHYCNPTALLDAGRKVLGQVAEDYDRWYRSRCTVCGSDARLEWLLWGDTVACASCSQPIRLWDVGFDHRMGVMSGTKLHCPYCETNFPRLGARVLDSAPVWASVTCKAGCGRMERMPLYEDVALAAAIALSPIHDWYPHVLLSRDREMYIRSALERHSVSSVADFYTARNLRALARLWACIQAWPDLRVRQALSLAFTNTAWHGTRMRRYNARGGQRPLTGTLYIPQMSVEVNVAGVFQNKINQLARFYASEPWDRDAQVETHLASATNLSHLESATIDYVFTDPPFGANIFYADCAVIAESWLGALTDVGEEAVVNRSLSPAAGGKTIADYQSLMTSAFGEVARVLKPRGRATVVFQNTDPAVWQALEDALETAGLTCLQANTLDKSQHSHKGYKGRSGAEDVAGFDMILTLRHAEGTARRRSLAHDVPDAESLLRRHLDSLPPIGSSPASDRQRTLPYLYSLLLESHFNGAIGLQERGYARVREICATAFVVDAAGRWYVDDPSDPGWEENVDAQCL